MSVKSPAIASRLTTSFGADRGNPRHESPKLMMSVADRKLYAAENAGRAVRFGKAVSENDDLTNKASRTIGVIQFTPPVRCTLRDSPMKPSLLRFE